MKLRLAFLCVLLSVIAVSGGIARGSQTAPATPTIKVTSALVFLDVTVVDKKGRPVVSGLTKDDFTVTEDKIPEAIFSFETPEVHVLGAGGEDENPNGQSPRTIFVVDLLNSSFEDFAYIRYESQQFLKASPHGWLLLRRCWSWGTKRWKCCKASHGVERICWTH